jgi:DNA-directed RNA polymerase subunit beta'
MRTFHTGGVAGDDITQGLPRVEELFEARKPKKMAQMAEISGVVSIEETKRGSLVNVTVSATQGSDDPKDPSSVTYLLPYSTLVVKEGQMVKKGEVLTTGALSPHDVLRIRGVSAVHNYLIQEVLRVYRQQGVDINDKHIEVICREMMRKVLVEDAGDSTLLSGSSIQLMEFEDARDEVQARIDAGEVNPETGEPLRLPTMTRLLMGITKASLATDSFLSAASFQETTKVLTEAAIKGKIDPLRGLKENVIIGKLIPAGSGLTQFRQPDVPELEDQKKAEEAAEEEPLAEETAAEEDTSSLLADVLMSALAEDVGDEEEALLADEDSSDDDNE